MGPVASTVAHHTMLPLGLKVLPTDAHSCISVKVLRQRELLAQSNSSSSEMAFFQWLLHTRVQSIPISPTHEMPCKILLKSYSSFRSIHETGWAFCCSYIAGQVFSLPCPTSLSLWKGLFSKAFPNIPRTPFSVESSYWQTMSREGSSP